MPFGGFGRFVVKIILKTLADSKKVRTFATVITSRDGAEVARWAHNPKVVGSNPAPATKQEKSKMASLFCFIHINLLRELLNSLKKQLRNLSAFAGRFRSCYLVCRVKVLHTLLAKVGWMRRLAFSSRHEARGIVLLLARRVGMSV